MKRYLLLYYILLLFLFVTTGYADTLTFTNVSGSKALIAYDYKFYLEPGQTFIVKKMKTHPMSMVTYENTPQQQNFYLVPGKYSRLITIAITEVRDEEYYSATDAFWIGFQVSSLFAGLLILIRIVNLVRRSPIES